MKPRISEAAKPITHCVSTARYGDRYLGWIVLRKRGSMWMRPSANAIRVDTLDPALALAIVEFTTARKTRTQKIPYEAFATPCHDAAPPPVKPANLLGP